MFKDDLDHYQVRAEDARLLASHAGSHAIRDIHLDIARNYDLLAENARSASAGAPE